MTWTTHYHPPTSTPWQGHPAPQETYFFQLVQLLNLLNPISPQTQPAFALLGFCCDEGIKRNLGRTGAALGPDALRKRLASFPYHRSSLIFYDAGDIVCTDGDLETAQKALGEAVDLLLKHGMTPIVIGGGHEVAFGHYQGIAAAFPTTQLGIINIDAHLDMRPLIAHDQGSSGTPFLQIAKAHADAGRHFDYNCIGIQSTGNLKLLFETAKKHNVHLLFADDLHQRHQETTSNFMDRLIAENERLYLTICLDAFAASDAPGVSAPQAMGVTPWHVIPLIRRLAASGKMASYDIAELSPKYDIDLRTVSLAAHFVYEITHHHAGTSYAA